MALSLLCMDELYFPYFYRVMHIRHLFLGLLFLACFAGRAGAQSDASELYNTARTFLRSGDYANAILVLNRAVELAPENAEYRKQLAYAYYLNNNLDEAGKTIRIVLKSDAADEQTYQIAGNIYKAERDLKGAEKNYKRGLKQFPESGTLYNELGETYYAMRSYDNALQAWTTGIRAEPGFASNYYNAAKTYYYSTDKVWAIIYGEIFIDLERFTARTAEMKNILLASYKELFNSGKATARAPAPDGGKTETRPPFREAFLNALSKGSNTVLTRGITPETLVILRTRFLLEWESFYKLIYPFALFDYQQQLLREGLFEAYNQWVFGPSTNLSVYKGWVTGHEEVMNRLINYLNDHPLTPRKGEYYQQGKITFEPATLPK